jgi:hypothetical protein
MRPLDNAALWTEQGLTKLGLPVVNWEHGLGMPSAADTMAAHHKVLSDAAAAGVAPGKIGGVFGGILGTAPAMMIPGGPLVQGAVGGALSTTDPSDPTETAINAGLGAGGAGLTHGLLKAVFPTVSAPAKTLIQGGATDLTPGQLTGKFSPFGMFEKATGLLPLAGEMARANDNRSLAGFGKGLSNDVAQKFGAAGVRTDTGPEAVRGVEDAVTNAYNIKTPTGATTLDPPYAYAVNGIRDNMAASNNPFTSRMNLIINREIAARADPLTGEISDDGLKDAKEAINKEIFAHKGKGGWENDYADALKGLRIALTANLGRTSQTAQAQLANADANYPAFKTFQAAMGKASQNSTNDEYHFPTPQQLRSAVNEVSGRNAAAAGNVPYADYANAGKSVLARKFKDVMSPGHAAMEAMVGLGVGGSELFSHAGIPMLAGTLAGIPYHLPVVQKALGNYIQKMDPIGRLAAPVIPLAARFGGAQTVQGLQGLFPNQDIQPAVVPGSVASRFPLRQ